VAIEIANGATLDQVMPVGPMENGKTEMQDDRQQRMGRET
jgi:hypothetical protein